MTIGIFAAALLVCAICAVEWGAARTDAQHRTFKIITLISGGLAVVMAAIASHSGWTATPLVLCVVGAAVTFLGYFVFRAVTRKG